MRYFITALLIVMTPSIALAQRDLKTIPDPDPEIERQSFVVADGFEVNLFAADPILAKPIQINFDPQGRLWVASSEVYPQISPGQVANDKVVILEDRDGDGKSDVTSVFADGLLIPTGIAPGDGGAYVANSTELLHFRDTDGDGKADQRRVVLSGFGTEDTHHILHTLRWGLDGCLYMNQSIYIHSHIETPHGVRRLNGGGIWRYRPEPMKLEVFVRGFVNPWGDQWDRWGQAFATDGAGGEGINFLIPGASYFTAVGAPRVLKGLNPGSPKYCGLEILSGGHLPDAWQGNILTNDFRANRVCRFVLSDDGSGFAAREQGELIKTRHGAFRPIDVAMGPDGAIYIADWYNPIIQHGEVDFRDPRRDHVHGRIWRVTAKNRPLVARPQLVSSTIPGLLDALKAPEDFTRRQAHRVLQEKGAGAVLPALADWVKSLGPDADHERLEALWIHQTFDTPNIELLDRCLRSPDPRLRSASVRVAGDWADRLTDSLARLTSFVGDENPRVRLEAVRALARIEDPRAIEVATRVLDRPMDVNLEYALWLACRDLQPLWLPELQGGRLDFDGEARHLTFALEAVGSKDVVAPLLVALRSGRVEPSKDAAIFRIISTSGGPNELKDALDLALADPGRLADRLKAIVGATRSRKVKPGGDLSRLIEALKTSDPASKAAAIKAIGAWGVEASRPALVGLGINNAEAEPVRLAAIEALADLGGPASREYLDALAASEKSPNVRARAILGLASLDLGAAASRAVEDLKESPSIEVASDLFGGLVGRKGGPTALSAALKGKMIAADLARIGIRITQQSGQPEPVLIEALKTAGSLSTRALLTPEEVSELVAESRKSGDPARGETIYRRSDLACSRCHAIAGAGGQVGPGLESIGASAQADYLVDSMLQPEKAVKEGYHALVVATNDGRVVSGIKVRQTDSEILLRDADGRDLAIPSASIEDQKIGGSLMPAGLVDNLTRPELLDLVRFLSELGKAGPYAVGQARVARRWQVLEPTAETLAKRLAGGIDPLAIDRLGPWSPAYSLVSGALPAESIPDWRRADANPRFPESLVRCQVEVTTPGRVLLRINQPANLWVDDRKIKPGKEFSIDLAAGFHDLTFAVDLATIASDGLRCELLDVADSPARVRFVLGK